MTSPPYYGLRVYKTTDDRVLGLEPTIEEYIANLVEVFREVWRVLRDDGVCWINLGDSYAGSPSGSFDSGNRGQGMEGGEFRSNKAFNTATVSGLSQGNRLGIPERVALALQADGWVWRDTIIWAKKSAMPESLAGWRWERCRVKVKESPCPLTHGHRPGDNVDEWIGGSMGDGNHQAEWTDCPGCTKCADNDGLVLRKGSWRCTSSHEYIFMLTKSMGYYADGDAVKLASDANRRSVWNDISPEPYGGSHFATFPPDLPRLCIQASTSEGGICPKCGSQITRIIDKPIVGTWHDHTENLTQGGRQNGAGPAQSYEVGRTVGWRPSCGHTEAIKRPDPALVLDPFMGTGTTALAAMRLGRRCVGTELSEDYLGQARKRLSEQSLPLPLVGTPSGHQES